MTGLGKGFEHCEMWAAEWSSAELGCVACAVVPDTESVHLTDESTCVLLADDRFVDLVVLKDSGVGD